MHNQPPKSPLSGGLHEASLRGATGECLHIYNVHHNSVIFERCTGRVENAPHRRSWKQRLPNRGSESVYLFLQFTIVCGLRSQSNRSWYRRILLTVQPSMLSRCESRPTIDCYGIRSMPTTLVTAYGTPRAGFKAICLLLFISVVSSIRRLLAP